MVDRTDCLCSEYLPIFQRLELIKGEWKSTTYPPNRCGTRDIPKGAVFHPSVKARMLEKETDYHPKNDGFPKI